jgi:hypothetical protein
MTVVRARPVISARIAYGAAAVTLVVFVLVAILMRRDNAGVTFVHSDQIGTVVLGLFIAAGFLILARPRLIADAESVRSRSFLGNYRTIPWDVIVDVQFPSTARFARVVLPGEEVLALYAVQRLDAEQSVVVMRGLRALLREQQTAR